MERHETEAFLELIPQQILNRLKPFKGRLDEVVSARADFAHLKYHTLDEKLIFRFCDRRAYLMRNQVLNADMDESLRRQMLSNPSKLLDLDIVTFERIEQAIDLHDRGRGLATMGILKPEEHHFGSLFLALMINGDPIVCNAVMDHIHDVLPPNSSIVSRCVRDIDRVAGSGYIGLIRLVIYHGFQHLMIEEKNEDTIILNGLMMTAQDRHGQLNEDLAEEFFWDEVFPFFESKGDEGMKTLRSLCKIILDRAYGRDCANWAPDKYQLEAIGLDNNILVVEPIMQDFQIALEFKFKNTLKVMARARGAKNTDDFEIFKVLTVQERDLYKSIY